MQDLSLNISKKIYFVILIFGLINGAFAQEQLISNFSFSTIPSLDNNDLWVVCRGSKDNGMSLMELADSENPSVESFQNYPMSETPVNNNFIADLTGENRKVNSVKLQTQIVLAAFDTSYVDGNSGNGLIVISKGISDYLHLPLNLGEVEGQTRAITSMELLDENTLALAYGRAGLGIVNLDQNKVKPGLKVNFYRFNNQNLELDSVAQCELNDPQRCLYATTLDNESESDLKKYSDIIAFKKDSLDNVWVGTETGFYKSDLSLLNFAPQTLNQDDSARVSGIWIQDSIMYVETSKRLIQNNTTKSELFFSNDWGSSFNPVFAIDSIEAGGVKKRFIYDSLDVSLSGMAIIRGKAWGALNKIEGTLNGLLVLHGDTIQLNKKADNDLKFSEFAFGVEDGFNELDVRATDIKTFNHTFSGSTTKKWLVASTFGGGVSISTDSGQTWISIMNRTAVKGDLDEIRTIPSYLRFSNEKSRIAYRISKDAKVTIEVYSYDMQKVRTIVKSAPRSADPIRSSNAIEDVWDGKDQNAKHVAVGLYYILVKDNRGHKGWGKIMWLGGR